MERANDLQESVDGKTHQGLNADEYRSKLLEHFYFEEVAAFEEVIKIAKTADKESGKALLVGGAVRDEIFGNYSKDFDVEIYNVPPERIKKLASEAGKTNEVGASFGIIKLRIGNIDIDLSVPRRESKTGKGHKGFMPKPDPNMSIKEAARRRDFTMNSLAKDVLTGKIYDYFGGIKDIQEKVLKVTDKERFRDDPLRVLRAVQFVGRYGLKIDEVSSQVIKETKSELKDLPKERLKEEWSKLFLHSPKPSMGLNAAMEFGVFQEMHKEEILPLRSTPQELEWHPEGDVWTHTLMVTDEAAKIIKEEKLEGNDALIVMLGAFCHDFGKPSTTKENGGKIRSIGHEEAGEEPAKKFLSGIGIEEKLRTPIIKLIKDHLKPSIFYQEEFKKGNKVSDGAIRGLAKRIHPATLRQLILVAKADHLGRGPFPDPKEPEKFLVPSEYPAGEWLLDKAENLNIEKKLPPPVIQGRDLIALGFKEGKSMGEIIKVAGDLRDNKEFGREDILSLIYENKEKPATEVIKIMISKLK